MADTRAMIVVTLCCRCLATERDSFTCFRQNAIDSGFEVILVGILRPYLIFHQGGRSICTKFRACVRFRYLQSTPLMINRCNRCTCLYRTLVRLSLEATKIAEQAEL